MSDPILLDMKYVSCKHNAKLYDYCTTLSQVSKHYSVHRYRRGEEVTRTLTDRQISHSYIYCNRSFGVDRMNQSWGKNLNIFGLDTVLPSI